MSAAEIVIVAVCFCRHDGCHGQGSCPVDACYHSLPPKKLGED
jgi:hypothetical protein